LPSITGNFAHVKPAENRLWHNPANGPHCTWNRRILAQRQVRAQDVVIVQVRPKDVTKVLFPEHNDMVSALPSDRSDQPFGIGILPWRSRSGRSISDAHRASTPGECFAVGPISIAQDICWDPFPRTGLNDLSGDPLGGRMRCHPHPQDAASIMAQDQQAVEEPERNRRNPEQVRRGDAIGMVAKKRPPTLRRRSPAPRHILRHARLPDVDAELEEFAVNPRCAP